MSFELRFTDKEIMPWSGMQLIKRMLDAMGSERALNACDLPQPGSKIGVTHRCS